MGRTPNASKQARALFREMLKTPDKWRYGYELSHQTDLLSGTLYPLLIRLSDQGLLEAKWEEPARPGKPSRHAYRLTPNGVSFAQASLTQDAGLILRPKLGGAVP